MFRVIKPTMLPYTRPGLSGRGFLVPLFSRREYTPDLEAGVHRYLSLDGRLMALEDTWKHIRENFKDPRHAIPDKNGVKPFDKLMRDLKKDIANFEERSNALHQDYLSTHASRLEHVINLKANLNKANKESHHAKKALADIRDYCDSINKDYTEPQLNIGEKKTPIVKISVEEVLKVILDHCGGIKKDHAESEADPGDIEADKTSSSTLKYRLDDVERDFGIPMSEWEPKKKTKRDYKPMEVNQKIISDWRLLVNYQERYIAYTREMLDTTVQLTCEVSDWWDEEPRSIVSSRADRPEIEGYDEMLREKYEKLKNGRNEIYIAMQDPLASCCAYFARYLAENEISKPDEEDWMKKLKAICPPVMLRDMETYVYADERRNYSEDESQEEEKDDTLTLYYNRVDEETGMTK
ncbi:hypothetical protein ACMFMG_011553 [Clarireedia jacksonii]